MQMSQWFYQQLEASTEGFVWAVGQIPQEHLYTAPRPGRWSVARIVYHMMYYDQHIGLPTVQQWLGGPCPETISAEEDGKIEEARWNNGEGHAVPDMLTTFRTRRAEQLTLIQQFAEPTWYEERKAIWGPRTLTWAVTKTYQHTLEHTDELLRSHLWHKWE